MRSIYLIRHGQSEIHGRPWKPNNLPLSDLGIEQAKAVSRGLSEINFSAIYTSPLKRALQTAEIIAKPHDMPLIQVDDLREIDTGIFSDKTNREVVEFDKGFKDLIEFACNGPLVAQMLDYFPGLSFPEGESAGQMVKRVVDAWEQIVAKIIEKDYQETAVVSHAGTQTVILRHLTSHTLASELKNQVFDNTSVSVVEITDTGDFSISSLNNVDHLDSL